MMSHWVERHVAVYCGARAAPQRNASEQILQGTQISTMQVFD